MRNLTKDEQSKILSAIQEAENTSSGEIVLFLCKKSKGEIYDYAQKIFLDKKLYQTKQRNAVLIVLAYKEQKLAILGDEGINKLVSECFWSDVKDLMIEHFKKEEVVEGLADGIIMIGDKLKEFFPPLENDVNELSNEILHED